MGEFNGDANPDLAVARFDTDNVSVLLGDGGGSFAAAAGSPFSAGGAPFSVAVAEFNGDQDPDLAVANSETGDVSVLLGGPGGSFVTATGSPFPVGNSPRDVAVGEFNGNADPDLAVANQLSNNVSVLLGANGYARPAGATPLRVPLVPAYRVCRAPNRSHAPPLASPSCAPPTQLSQYVTVGTFDANGEPANSIGFVRLHVLPGNPATPVDEANVGLAVSVTDVRNTHDLSDYTGELQVSMTFQLTDSDIAAAPGEPGTLQQLPGIRFTVPCAATGGAVGSTCSVNTTADAITPGIVKEGDRAIWQLGQVIVLDGGEDGLASTPDDNTIFLRQGVFVP